MILINLVSLKKGAYLVRDNGVTLDISMLPNSDLRIKLLRSGEILVTKDINLSYFLDRPNESYTLEIENILKCQKK